MSHVPIAGVLVILLAAALSGCSIGYTRVLFVTKTNVGLEASTQPPVIQLNIARTEGVVAPQFENGKKLPVMASFRFNNQGIFAPAVGSTFATGDAATTLAALYKDDTPYPDWQGRAAVVARPGALPTDSTLTLDRQPEIRLLPEWMPGSLDAILPGPKFQDKDVRPVFFGTDTSLGIKISWSGMAGEFPDTAVFGYNRKELAWVPISKETVAGRPGAKMRLASLLATVDSGFGAQGARSGLEAQFIQYFATGDAATLLSMQRDVRGAMLYRLDPNANRTARAFLGDDLAGRAPDIVTRALVGMVDGLRSLAGDGDAVAEAHVRRLDQTADQLGIPDNFMKQGLIYYSYSGPDAQGKRVLEKSTRKTVFSGAPSFTRATAYWKLLRESIGSLRLALGDLKEQGAPPVRPTVTVKLDDVAQLPVAFSDSLNQELVNQIANHERALNELDAKLRANRDVTSAYQYFSSLLMPR